MIFSSPGKLPLGTLSAFAFAVALGGGRPALSPQLVVIDGGSGKTRAIGDWNNFAHVVDQPDTTKQCALPTPDSGTNNQLALTFTGVEQYVSNLPVSYWGDYQAAGGVAFTIVTPTATGVRVYWETTDVFTQPYLLHYQNSTGPHFRGEFRTAVGASVSTVSVGTIALNTPIMSRLRWAYPTIGLRCSGTSETTNTLSTPPAGNPSRGFAISRVSAPLIGRLAGIHMSVPNVDLDLMASKLQSVYGVSL